MNESITFLTGRRHMYAAGFSKYVDAFDLRLCPLCGKPLNRVDFRDDSSKREFCMSGLCQACQDKVGTSSLERAEPGAVLL
jgi:hypothetical protein